jgi:carbon-monoxide dehydrogenase medium subunit
MAAETGTRYHDPADLEEALSTLAALGEDATVLAGGQDLVRSMNLGEWTPSHIVDINGLPELTGIEESEDGIEIGALVTHTELASSPKIAEGCPVLLDARKTIGGGQQIHNCGTVGGAVCSAEPVYDYPPCLVVLGATLLVQGSDGPREIPAGEFFVDAGETAVSADELLTGINVPQLAPGVGTSYEKLKYTEGCYNIASATAVVSTTENEVDNAHLAIGGIEPVPRRLSEANSAAEGRPFDEAAAADVAAAARESVESPLSDIHAGGDYRRSMAGTMAERAMESAYQRATTAADGGTTEGPR